MGGEQDGGLLPHGQEDIQYLLTAHGIQGGGGLVADEELGASQEGLGDAEALLHASGVAPYAVGLVLQSHQFQKLAAAGFVLGGGQSRDLSAEGKVLLCGHEGVEFGDVGKVADKAVGLGLTVLHPLAVDVDLPSVGLEQTQDGLHGGGLTRAVLADEAEEAMARYRKIQPPQYLLVSESLVQIRDAKHIHHASSLPKRK